MHFVQPEPTDPIVDRLLLALAAEYSLRYGRTVQQELEELRNYPHASLHAEDGLLILAVEAGRPVASGGFRRLDAHTAELKRLWVEPDLRGHGFGKAILDHLERRITERGYTRIWLQTGPAQPEAVALYLSAGYTPHFDPSLPPARVGIHRFSKQLHNRAGAPGHAIKEST
ncbi:MULTISPECIES: GNAT family N-acetyltransferase [Nocardia]|uniref:GNAT family N-acetyltransferase n=1 Tax=Nocardia TaxID=1817 RepID=UPI000BF1B8A9|nr:MULTISPECIES: GNAT family N-acetyltransferase [Nocardia]MBF6187037.1 GNAT family N-acetyltransferase [Nocardia farcinica]MBF6312684.1 GNAT family N-acetyltransferase [Nocardia farcinica]MBF6408461.1 GNAT family N-acetyltransferase [Nocardia farcinica]PEH78920.1 GNAT family N-acetyltransferase [Nocardia sp. FDAARGOS_372]UEX23546.1 GNAT family N-acetyltransferase [Nocardia farcinica]